MTIAVNRRIRHRRNACRRGNVLIEMALCFTILLMLVFGGIEYGYYVYVKHTLQGAARDGARTAILQSSNNAAVNNAVNRVMIAAGMPQADYPYTVSIKNADTNANVTLNSSVSAGTPIKVEVTMSYGDVGVCPLSSMSLPGLPDMRTKTVRGFTIMLRE